MVMKIVILAIILAGLFSGCIGEESIVGKYVSTADNNTYFNLYEDGTFTYFYSHGSIPSESGTYKIVDGKLMLTFQPWGVVVPFTGVGIIEQLEYNFLTGHPALSVYFVKGGGRKYE